MAFFEPCAGRRLSLGLRLRNSSDAGQQVGASDPDVPASRRGRGYGVLDRGAKVSAAEAIHRGGIHQREGGPAIAGDERRVVRGGVVRDPHVRDRPGQRPERPPVAAATAGSVTRSPAGTVITGT